MLAYQCCSWNALFFLDDLIQALKKTKALLMEKVDQNNSRPQKEITAEIDTIVQQATSK